METIQVNKKDLEQLLSLTGWIVDRALGCTEPEFSRNEPHMKEFAEVFKKLGGKSDFL